jgi:DNA invertase Pin-like site-specific DNA recombinase
VAKRHGWEVVGSYTDRLSGARSDRPGLGTALDLIFRARAEILVVHDLDRLGRDVLQMLHNVDAIHAAGGNFFVRDRNLDTSTAEGRLIFTIFGALAEFQRNGNRERILAGLAYARKKGVRLGRPGSIPPPVLARAVKMRRQYPPPSWRTIVRELQHEKLGRFPKGTIAGAVTRALRAQRKARGAGDD